MDCAGLYVGVSRSSTIVLDLNRVSETKYEPLMFVAFSGLRLFEEHPEAELVFSALRKDENVLTLFSDSSDCVLGFPFLVTVVITVES